MTTVQSIHKTATDIDYKHYFQKGLLWTEYNESFQAEMYDGQSLYAKYLPQNWRRQSRLARKTQLNKALLSEIASLNQPLNWLVITEHWCGDASQINPLIYQVAKASQGKINLRFTYRDTNKALIDAHLTDGHSRSIPILLQLDKEYNFLNAYGPRPAEAQMLVKSILADGGDYSIPLHSWYAKNKQVAIQDDLLELLQKIP